MSTITTQLQKMIYCRGCKAKTLHVGQLKKMDMGCSFWAGNLFLCLLTLGLWLPIFVMVVGIGTFANALARAEYQCSKCGKSR